MRRVYHISAFVFGAILATLSYFQGKMSLFELVFAFLLLIGIIIMADIDIRTYEIPNSVLLYFLALGAVRILSDFSGLRRYLLGFFVMGLLLLLIAVVSGGKLGGGDVKLMAIAGLILGIFNVMVALALGSMVGSVIGVGLIASGKIKRRDYLPFGPFLAVGIYLAFLYGDAIWRWFLTR